MQIATEYCDRIQPICQSPSSKTILLLGGYGTTGWLVARLLVKTTTANVKLIIAGRNIQKAERAASDLNVWSGSARCSAARIDASQPLLPFASYIDLVVVALPSTYSVEHIAEAVIHAGHSMDYLDMNYSTQKLRTLQSLEPKIQTAGCCFVTDGGFHPGLPAAMVRYAALQGVDRLKTAMVGIHLSQNWGAYNNVGIDTQEEFLMELMNFQPSTYSLGQWKTSSMLYPTMIPIDFGLEIGTRQCIAMDMAEMHQLPVLYPDLQATGVYVAGFHWFVDLVLMPLVMGAVKLCPCRFVRRAMSRLFYWGLRVTAREPYMAMVKADVTGTNAGQNVAIHVSVRHEDGYYLTAAAVTACILQYLRGSNQKPGLWFQGTVVEPTRFLKDLEKMGVDIKCETSFLEDDWVTSLVLSDR